MWNLLVIHYEKITFLGPAVFQKHYLIEAGVQELGSISNPAGPGGPSLSRIQSPFRETRFAGIAVRSARHACQVWCRRDARRLPVMAQYPFQLKQRGIEQRERRI